MAKARVLLLGNSPQINEIQFDRIADDVITLGLNRIWLKYIPKYFFFHDLIISNELSRHPETLAKLIQNSTIFPASGSEKTKITSFLTGRKSIQCHLPHSFPIQRHSLFKYFQKIS